jgi:DNA-binding MarR family transcriptional regulator
MDPHALGFLVNDISRLMRCSMERRLEHTCLTLAQSRALVHIARNQGLRQVDLAEQLEIQPITLARLIDHLVEAGLVERRDDPVDRRAFHIYLTPAATPQLAILEKIGEAVRRETVGSIEEQQVYAVMSVLHQMRNNLSAKREEMQQEYRSMNVAMLI